MKIAAKLGLTVTSLTLAATGTAAAVVYQTAQAGTANLVGIMATVAGVTIVSATITVLILSRQTRPIRALSAAIARISLGDLSQTVPVTSHDELGALGQNFNEMTHQLATTYRSLEASTKTAKDERAQLYASINGLRQGFILVDLKNQVLMANTAATETISGKGTGPITGNIKPAPTKATKKPSPLQLKNIAHVLPKDLELEKKIEQTLKDRQLAKFPDLPLGGRFLNLYLSPVISESEAIGCVLLLEDVTEERIMNRSRDEFFSIASHELRTPLTAIRGNTDMIKQYFPDILKDPSVGEMINDIHESTVRLIEIVNDFLDTSRLEQDKMKLSPTVFSLEKNIEKIMYEMAGLSREKKLTLAFDQSQLGKLPQVYADPGRITQIIYNLIGNAMKFTQKGSVIINCLVEDTFIKVTVSDTGQGISDEGKQILFHKFQQSTSDILTRDNTRGTGLGLYISKLLIEHMGGEIKLEHTEVGKGSTFSFTVPVATKAQIAAAKNTSAAVSALSIDN